jgi:hypothetical protein
MIVLVGINTKVGIVSRIKCNLGLIEFLEEISACSRDIHDCWLVVFNGI